MKRTYLLILLFSVASSLAAQVAPGKYFVQFTDKNNNPYNINAPWEFLSQRALDRRSAQGIAITETDLPVTPSYVESVAGVGVTPIIRVKWLNGIVILCTDTNLIQIIEGFPFVQKVVKNSGPGKPGPAVDKFEPETTNLTPVRADRSSNLKSTLSYNYGQSYNQIAMVNGDKLHDQGYRGQGKVIAVLDAGFIGADTIRTFDSLFANGQILGGYNFVEPGASVYSFHPHGTMVLSVMGGILPGELIGTAPKADYWLLRSEDGGSEYLIEEYNWVAAAAFADSVGADVINSSLGYTQFDDPSQNHTCADMNGNTTPATQGANIAAQRGIVVVNSAGNSGGSSWMCVGAPADGTDVLAIAAVDSNGIYAPFSSWGTINGSYVKPNVAGQGAMTVVSWTDGTVVRSNGTSFSSPLIAGMVATLWSARPGLSAIDVRRMIEQSGSRFGDPDTLIGFGIPDFFEILTSGPVNRPDPVSVHAYPNPFTGPVTLLISSDRPMKVSATLWSVTGERVFSSPPMQVVKGENRLDILPPSTLGSGLYLVQISDLEGGSRVASLKIQKR